MDKKLTPFHCWTEYWKAKEMAPRLMVESRFGENQDTYREYKLLDQRIVDWEKRHITP